MQPVHVSIIMDGNGRWATARGLSRSAGHAAGAESVRACMRAAVKRDVKYLSLYTFSQENWNRPDKEVAAIMDLMSYNIRKELPEFHENKVGFKVIGDMDRLTPRLRGEIEAAEAETAQYTDHTLIRKVGYRAGCRAICKGLWHRQRQAAGELSGHRRHPRSRPSHPHRRGAADKQLYAVAVRLQRILFYRQTLA